MKRHSFVKTLRKRSAWASKNISSKVYASMAGPLVSVLVQRTRMLDRFAEKVAQDIVEVNVAGEAGPMKRANGRLSILALTPEKFRFDLEVLATRPDLRVLRMSSDWQRKLLHLFYAGQPSQLEVHNPRPGSGAQRCRAVYRRFLKAFLPRFYNHIGVDVVLGANVRYAHDLDWGFTSEQLGTPYVVFHRENLPVGDTRVFGRIRDRYASFGSFQGTCIAVHNGSTTNTFRKAGFIGSERIHVLGCLRMDPYLRRLSQPRPKRDRPLVLLFSFQSFSPSTFGRGGYYAPFRDCHAPLARLAKERPEIDVVIKPKPSVAEGKKWNVELIQALQEGGVDRNDMPPNLWIDPFSDAQDLILSASVVVAFNSTTLIEAAIAGLPVIMPNFRYVREGPYANDVLLREYSHLFDVPDTAEDLVEMVLYRLRDPSIPDEIMEGRRRLFADALSALDGNATERYVQLLKRVVSDRRPASNRSFALT